MYCVKLCTDVHVALSDALAIDIYKFCVHVHVLYLTPTHMA